MLNPRHLIGILAIATSVAQAQSATPPVPGTAVQQLKYESAFADYKPFLEIEVLSWRESNDEAARLGGHMGQMKHDAMSPMMPSAKPPAAPAAKSPTPAPSHPLATKR